MVSYLNGSGLISVGQDLLVSLGNSATIPEYCKLEHTLNIFKPSRQLQLVFFGSNPLPWQPDCCSIICVKVIALILAWIARSISYKIENFSPPPLL